MRNFAGTSVLDPGMSIEAGYRIVAARRRDLYLLAAIELAAAQLLRGHAPETVLAEVTSEDVLRDAQREGRLWVALAGDVPVGFAHVELFEPNAIVEDEARRGLDPLRRVIMRWARGPSSTPR